jgi:uncharacterized protein (TIGR02757 family)
LSARESAVKRALDGVRARCDVTARREADPVSFVHRYASPHDRELVALAAACVAFGNVKAIRAKLGDLLARLGPHPALFADDGPRVRAALDGWKHRVFRDDDVARLLTGARRVQRKHGSLGRCFEGHMAAAQDPPGLRGALSRWCEEIREAGGLRPDGTRRGPSHLLPDPRGSSGCKRLLLFLRWMSRAPDGIDVGGWNVDPAALLVPVDVHIHKLARNLGLTRRSSPSWTTAEEITAALARFDPHDPTKYDFALCHMGMLQRCPSRKDARRCEGCGVKPVCVHWSRSASRSASRTASRTGEKGPGTC